MERKSNWGADHRVDFADFAFKVAFIRPMHELHFAAVDDEPRGAGVGLDDVLWLWVGVF